MELVVIPLGDPTSHGAKVISASMSYTNGGIGIARAKDIFACPLHSNDANLTTPKGSTYFFNGKKVALKGYKSSCTCLLISTVATFSYG